LRKHVKALTLDIGPPKIASPARTGSSPSRQLPSMTLCLWEAIGHAASAEFLLVPLTCRLINVTGLEAGASWEYLTDGGALPGSTTLLHMIGDKIGALLAGFRIK
jgi:hypothetical protein